MLATLKTNQTSMKNISASTKKWRVWLIVVLAMFSARQLAAQTVLVGASPLIVCLGSPCVFTCNATGSPTAFSWDFGNGQTSSLQNPTYTYPASGTYTAKCTVTYASGPVVKQISTPVIVHKLPTADWVLTTEDTQCFRNNRFCIVDNSARSTTSNAAIVKRKILWGDGNVDSTTQTGPGVDAPKLNLCHTFPNTSPPGLPQSYTFVMEITDENGCVGRKEIIHQVHVFGDLGANFRTSFTLACDSTPVRYFNNSLIAPADLKKFTWLFGNGDTYSGVSTADPKWDNFIYWYKTNGVFNATLILESKYGCSDTFTLNAAGQNYKLVFDIRVDKDSMCFAGNAFTFSQTPVSAARFMWNFGDPNSGPANIDTVSWSPTHEFTACGKYTVTLWMKAGPCTKTDTLRVDWTNMKSKVKQVKVMGPTASIQNPMKACIKNRFQCHIKDTVYITNLSTYCEGDSADPITGIAPRVKRFWDTGDMFAPTCTSYSDPVNFPAKFGYRINDTMNVNKNCRYTLDSLPKHWYSPGQERCYTVKLVLTDPVTGCADSAQESLALSPPDATNLQWSGQYCLGPMPPYGIQFQWPRSKPGCTQEFIWINFDSACGKNNFTPQTGFSVPPWPPIACNWPTQYKRPYFSYCSTDGCITIGVIIQNGCDSQIVNGNKTCVPCRDTVWYHDAFCFKDLFPAFTDNKFSFDKFCVGDTLVFTPNRTKQKDIISMAWTLAANPPGKQFNGYVSPTYAYVDSIWRVPFYRRTHYQYINGNLVSQFNYDTNLVKMDSIVALRHRFTHSGKWRIRLDMQNIDTCEFGYRGRAILVGNKIDFNVSDTIVCVNGRVDFDEDIYYFWPFSPPVAPTDYDPTKYWDDRTRNPLGNANTKERVWYDFGKGSGFGIADSNPKVFYPNVGNYTIKIAFKDSDNCRDTIVFPNMIHVVDPVANFRLSQTKIVCGQIAQFLDSSYVINPPGNIKYDSVVAWLWDFGDGKTPSVLQNPFHDYTSNGTFKVKLKVWTYHGCTDSITKEIKIIGPDPNYRIKGNRWGCAPFTVCFEAVNSSDTTVTSVEWSMGDGTVISRSKPNAQAPGLDTFCYTYSTPGIYKVRILGKDSVVDQFGVKKSCSKLFPDTINNPGGDTLIVEVIRTPNADFTLSDTVICVGEQLTLTDASDPNYIQYNWDLGDGTNQTANSPTKSVSHSYNAPGTYVLRYTPDSVPSLRCSAEISKSVKVVDVLADFTIDSTNVPIIKFTNASSANAAAYEWDFGHPASGSENNSTLKDPEHNYKNDTGCYVVRLITTSTEGCKDTAYKTVCNFFLTHVRVPNVFTPTKDGINDKFEIDIEGETMYNLSIYNRWGEKLFTSEKDGDDWDGTNSKTNVDCPDGVYYYVFKYQLRGQDEAEIRGDVTLIRKQ